MKLKKILGLLIILIILSSFANATVIQPIAKKTTVTKINAYNPAITVSKPSLKAPNPGIFKHNNPSKPNLKLIPGIVINPDLPQMVDKIPEIINIEVDSPYLAGTESYMTVTAVDNIGLKSIKLKLGSQIRTKDCGYQTSCTKTFTISETTPDTYVYLVIATDTNDNTNTELVSVVVEDCENTDGDGVCDYEDACVGEGPDVFPPSTFCQHYAMGEDGCHEIIYEDAGHVVSTSSCDYLDNICVDYQDAETICDGFGGIINGTCGAFTNDDGTTVCEEELLDFALGFTSCVDGTEPGMDVFTFGIRQLCGVNTGQCDGDYEPNGLGWFVYDDCEMDEVCVDDNPECQPACLGDSDEDSICDNFEDPECVGQNSENLPEDTTCISYTYENGCHEIIYEDAGHVVSTTSCDYLDDICVDYHDVDNTCDGQGNIIYRECDTLTYDDGTTVCDNQGRDYSCLEGTSPGKDIFTRDYITYCGVDTGQCNGIEEYIGSWSVHDDCNLAEQCVEGNSQCTISPDLLNNEKDMTKYENKEVFMISTSIYKHVSSCYGYKEIDVNWQDILSLVPVTTWTDNGEVHKYPSLIYYGSLREYFTCPSNNSFMFMDGFDADSSVYFLQQYSPDELTLIGSNHTQEFQDLLVADQPFGAGLLPEQIDNVMAEDYLSYWSSYSSVVYVEEDYELALLASTYASLINSPLIIENTALDIADTFIGRDVICVGTVNPVGTECGASYALESLQELYAAETDTDKILLLNPNDLFMDPGSGGIQPERSSGLSVTGIFSKDSLAAPFLASAKHELILSTNLTYYEDVNEFIENKIVDLNLHPEYLTIIANPIIIDNTLTWESGRKPTVDYGVYSLIDDDHFLDIAVGRIFGITVSDPSSNIARSLFYEETLKNDDAVLVARTAPMANTAAKIYGIGKVFEITGYNTTIKPDISQPDDWKDKLFIFTRGHGWTDFAGIDDKEIPYLDNTLVVSHSCDTCDFVVGNKNEDLFCTNALRRGAIGYVGATDAGGNFDDKGFIAELFTGDKTVGKALLNSKNNMANLWDIYNRDEVYMLLGDPTFELKTKYKMPSPQLELINEDQDGRDYRLSVSAIRIDIPDEIFQISELYTYHGDVPNDHPYYFSTAHLMRDVEIFRSESNNYTLQNFALTNKQFSAVFNLGDFYPDSITDDWNYIIDYGFNDKIWISSPSYLSDLDIDDTSLEGYFTDANDYEFTNYEYNIHLSE